MGYGETRLTIAGSGVSSISNTGPIFVSTARLSDPDLLLTPAVAVQNYITAILIFLMIEMLMTWGFYGTFLGSSLST